MLETDLCAKGFRLELKPQFCMGLYNGLLIDFQIEKLK